MTKITCFVALLFVCGGRVAAPVELTVFGPPTGAVPALTWGSSGR